MKIDNELDERISLYGIVRKPSDIARILSGVYMCKAFNIKFRQVLSEKPIKLFYR